MKRYLPFIIVIAVALITIAGAAALYRAQRVPVLTISKDQAVAGGSGHIRGKADAPVTLEEYGDFECPPCGKLSGVIKQLEEEHHSQLRVVFRHFPLTNHRHARAAAYAAEAAGQQGRFWEMHDLLYREQPVWSKTNDAQSLFNAYAGMLGLNLERFKKDAASKEVEARVEADQKHGSSLGVTNTPTIFIDNKAVAPTALNPMALQTAVGEAIKAKASPEAENKKP